MRPLRELLTSWENWSARDTLTRALGRASTEDAREALRRGLAETPEVDPLDALRDTAELLRLLSGWQWQVVHAARVAGASWEDIGAAIGEGGAEARDRFKATLNHLEQANPGAAAYYRGIV